jgi:carbon storage regulator
MLILQRKVGERIVINPGTPDEIRLVVYAIDRNRVRIGVDAPRDVPVYRAELLEDGMPGASVLPIPDGEGGITTRREGRHARQRRD